MKGRQRRTGAKTAGRSTWLENWSLFYLSPSFLLSCSVPSFFFFLISRPFSFLLPPGRDREKEKGDSAKSGEREMYVRTARKVRTTYSLGTFWCYGTVQISFADGTFVSASVTFKKEMAAKGGGGWRLTELHSPTA